MSHENDISCLQGGKRHRVNESELQEATSKPDGGTVVCVDCGKPIERGPTNLQFRGEIAS